MRVFRDTPFELSFMPWVIRPPQTSLMVLVKGTFALAPGECPIAPEQTLVNGDVPHEEGETPSLRTASDYAVLKPRGEWYLAGSAHAPRGEPVPAMRVSVKIGSVPEKAMIVWGDRPVRAGVLGSAPGDPRPFTTMPLGWERAYGGPSNGANPVGCAHPNIEHPERRVASSADRREPHGMFPIPPIWPARIASSGTYDERWKAERWPWFPEDFDYSFFQVAPADQRLRDGHFRGDEQIVLTGLHPVHATLRTRLPGLAPRVFLERVEGAVLPEEALPPVPRHARVGLVPPSRSARERLAESGPPVLEQVRLVLDTLVIDSDAGTVVATWRGLVEVADEDLSDVARIFYAHEPIDAERRPDDYARWLERLIVEELAEDDAMLAVVPEEWEDATEQRTDPDPRAQVDAIVAGALALIDQLSPAEPLPATSEVRRRFVEAGLEPPAELVDPGPVIVDPDDEVPASVLRLALLVRRRLGRSFAGMDLTAAPLQGLILRGADLSGATLVRAVLSRADLREAHLDGALLGDALLDDTDLRGATLRGTDMPRARAARARLEDACLDGATASGAELSGARLQRASLVGAELDRAQLDGASFVDGVLDGADLSYACLDGADFSRATLVDASLEGARARGSRFVSCAMASLRASEGADFSGASFELSAAPGAQLQQALLDDASFAGCDLSGADLSQTRGVRTNFTRARLAGARLEAAVLPGAVLLVADLFEATLEGADLRDADLRGAHLVAAQLWRAQLQGARLEGADLALTHAESA